jgi:predicted aldo/keto reductase-like oxidoreductase
MRRYAALARNATVCASCSAPCAPTCPTSVPIREKLLDAHGLLSFPA